MNIFERWMLRRMVTKACMVGGANHWMPEIYAEIRKTASDIFVEDNIPTLNWSLRQWFKKGLEEITPWDILSEKEE